MIRRAMFCFNQSKGSVYEAVSNCVALCRQEGIEPVFFEEDRTILAQHLPALAQDAVYLPAPVSKEVDALFVFGGDGTMLRALDAYVDCGLPMLGINLGRMGFLLETEVSELAEALALLRRGEYEVEHRMMLHVEANFGRQIVCANATNEVSISRGLSQRMIALDAYVGNTLVDHYIADGVVIASPTGSTAYSLSAGGPIVSPDVHCFVLNPICPHSLQSRPIVLSYKERVTLRINMKEGRDGIQLSIDGQAVCQMLNQQQIVVSRSPHDALLIRFPKERNFFSLLKDKLSQWTL